MIDCCFFLTEVTDHPLFSPPHLLLPPLLTSSLLLLSLPLHPYLPILSHTSCFPPHFHVLSHFSSCFLVLFFTFSPPSASPSPCSFSVQGSKTLQSKSLLNSYYSGTHLNTHLHTHNPWRCFRRWFNGRWVAWSCNCCWTNDPVNDSVEKLRDSFVASLSWSDDFLCNRQVVWVLHTGYAVLYLETL